MKLKSAKFHCYKSIIETNMDFQPDITCLVGMTGAGKTSILELIKKIQSDSGFNISDLTENSEIKNKFEQNNMKAEDIEQISAVFTIDNNDKNILPEGFTNATHVILVLYFDGRIEIIVEKNGTILDAAPVDTDKNIGNIQHYFNGIHKKLLLGKARFPNIDENIVDSIINKCMADIFDNPKDIKSFIQVFKNSLYTLPHDEQLKNELAIELTKIEQESELIVTKQTTDPYDQVLSHLPNIEYISKLPDLTDKYPLDDYLNDPKSNFTFNAIGIICGFNKNQINAIRNDDVGRNNYFKKCSEKLTNEFREYWTEINYELNIELVDNELMVLIKDEYTDHMTRTTQRSEGMRWALALFLKIKSIISSEGSSHIFLFDSPATAIHDSGKESIRRFLTKMASTDHLQIIYTTHEKALIDPWNLNQIRFVQKNQNGTSIQNIKGSKVDSTRIQIAKYIGSPAKYSIFGAPMIIFCEGQSDYRFLTALNECAIRNNKPHLDTDIYSIDDISGIDNYKHMMKICDNLNLKFCFVVDGGEKSKTIQRDYKEKFEKYFITLSDVIKKQCVDIEDLIHPKIYHNLFKQLHPDITVPPFESLHFENKKTVNIYSEILKQNEIERFEKNDIARYFMDMVKTHDPSDSALNDTLENYVKLVNLIEKKRESLLDDNSK